MSASADNSGAPIVPPPLVEEVRVAMALNGGVSLAIWMGGCAVELDCARRAHLSPELPADPSAAGSPEPRRLYNALCQAFGRELVLDIMSGASAGGINGALLAAASKARRRLDVGYVRERWIDLGDFMKLLHGENESDPAALMDGNRFHSELLRVFRAVVGDPGAEDEDAKRVALPGGQADLESRVVALDVTTTDLAGARHSSADRWGGSLDAREFRARFRFRGAGDYAADNLAEAARASASFPLAFEPWPIDGEGARRLVGFGERSQRWVVDGGLLDNAPISAALDLIPMQPASRQVRRYACYVNADPPVESPPAADEDRPRQPTTTTILGDVFGLPRRAPFVDQLYAVENARHRAAIADHSKQALLGLGSDHLQAVAQTLFPGYQARRMLESLEDLLAEPSVAMLLFGQLEADGEVLPWVPEQLANPGEGRWRWGIRTAERALHLLLDLIRDAAAGASTAQRLELFAARAAIGEQLVALAASRSELLADKALVACLVQMVSVDDVSSQMAALLDLTQESAASTREALAAGVAAAVSVAGLLDAAAEADAPPFSRALFGPPEEWADAAATFTRFLDRALAIEVVRRSMVVTGDIDSGQQVEFTQLTPLAPGLIFSERPFHEGSAPASPAAKLTGIEVGHFAGFYRRSWRANDFMWGRLDGAVAVVRMLVDAARARELGQTPEVRGRIVGTLADVLLPAGDETRAWLVDEALADWFAIHPAATADPPADTRAKLAGVIATDLFDGDGEFTQRVCIRAAQLEVVADELPILDVESTGDANLGASSRPLAWPIKAGLKATIEAARDDTSPDPGGPGGLPQRLGRTPEELASTLALRTMTRAGLVGVGVARTAVPPTSPVLAPIKAVLLPVAGVVAHGKWVRATAALAFWAAAVFITSRVVTTDPSKPAEVQLLWSRAALAMVVALLVVGGVVLVPLFRAYRTRRASMRLVQAVCAIGLLAVGGVGALILGWWPGPLAAQDLIVAPGSSNPPTILTLAVIALGLGVPIASLPVLGRPINALIAKPWAGPVVMVATVLASVGLIAWSVFDCGSAIWGESWWKTVACALSLVVAPVAILVYLFLPAFQVRAAAGAASAGAGIAAKVGLSAG